jgi:hypothetical protein
MEKCKLRECKSGILLYFGSDREEVTRSWRKLCGEEVHKCFSPIITRMMSSGRMRCMQHAWQRHKVHTKFQIGKLNGRYQLTGGGPDSVYKMLH